MHLKSLAPLNAKLKIYLNCHEKKTKNEHFENAENWVGVGTALGAAVFAITKEPTWIGIGVAIGAAISWKKL